MSTKYKVVIVSIAIGIAASLWWTLAVDFVYGPFGMQAAIPMLTGVGLSAWWVVRFAFLLVQYGKQGLWFLVGFPLGVLWPLFVFAVWWPCAAHWQCL